MAQLDDEWNSALDEEYGDTPDETPEEVEEEQPEEAEPTEEAEETPEEEAPETTDDEEEPEATPEEGEEAPSEEEQPEEAAPVVPQTETPSTREEIKAALVELENERKNRDSGLDSLKEEVLTTLYPEGVDRQLRDADGDPIKGIEDLTGVDPQTGAYVGNGLINPNTGEVFTEEEAGRYILRGQQRLNEQVQLMEDQAYQIAETHQGLRDSSERVETEFGPILNQLPPEISEQIADAYIKTLRRDPQTGIVVDVPLDAYEFYSIALAGAKPLLHAQPAQTPAVVQSPRSNKGDRADLGQRGTPTSLSKEDQEWETAFDEILN